MCSLHLVKYGIVASVNAISSIDICTNGIARYIVLADILESRVLVGRGMRSEDMVRVDVVCICSRASGMVFGEAQDIKVFLYGHDRVDRDMVLVDGSLEDRFDESAGDA
jgi:hypothetical protein